MRQPAGGRAGALRGRHGTARLGGAVVLGLLVLVVTLVAVVLLVVAWPEREPERIPVGDTLPNERATTLSR